MYFLYINFLCSNILIGIIFFLKLLKFVYFSSYNDLIFTLFDNCFSNSPLAYIVKIVISYSLDNSFAISTNTLSAPPNC